MSKLKPTLTVMLALMLLCLQAAPYRAAAQTTQAGLKTYEVTVTNITTSKQGLSPLVIATHPASAHAWQMGQLASKGLELIAEEGMPDVLASELKAVSTDVAVTKAHLLPGDSITVTITAKDGDVLSAASMLIQTNDGFTGLDSAPLTDGSKDSMAYDAGTEDNSEAAVDVPGPPFGGKNHGPDSSPHQPIGPHEGIKGKADVTPDFNWSGPVARFTIRTVNPSERPTLPTYEVTITNINNSKQGLSPLIVATHPASVHAWQMGQLASKGTELLAEEGMPTLLASELSGKATDIATTNAHLLPGDSITVKVTANNGDMLSAATMLIETNDGFTGLDSVPLTDGDKDTMAYDAGTEDNSEAAADVPGPPFGGKNHGPDSSPHQPIGPHEGIKGKADVTPDFNWSDPVARFTIRAIPATTTTETTNTPPDASTAANPPNTTTASTTNASMPNMPATGAPDATAWLITILAAALVLAGLTMRRIIAVRKQ